MPRIFCPPPNPSAGTLDSANNPAAFSNVPPAPNSLYGFGTLSLTPYPQVRQIRQGPTTAGQGLDFVDRPAMRRDPMSMSNPMPTFPVQFQDQYNSAQIQQSYNVNPYLYPAPAGTPSTTTQPSSSSPMYAGEPIVGHPSLDSFF